jgi:hypothetical protein
LSFDFAAVRGRDFSQLLSEVDVAKKLALGLAVAVAVLGCVATSTSGGQQKIYGVQDCHIPKVKPKRIVLACADFGLFANHFHWSHWGHRKAKAKGVLHAKVCKPSCAEGFFKDYPVEIVLRRIKTRTCNGKRARYYTKVKLNFPGAHPQFAHRAPTDLFCV